MARNYAFVGISVTRERGNYGGWIDCPLSRSGQKAQARQAKRLADYLARGYVITGIQADHALKPGKPALVGLILRPAKPARKRS